MAGQRRLQLRVKSYMGAANFPDREELQRKIEKTYVGSCVYASTRNTQKKKKKKLESI